MKSTILAACAAIAVLSQAPAAVAQQRAEQHCREYTREIRSGAQGNQFGTMCLQPDGTWKIMDVGTDTQRSGTVIQAGPSSVSGHGHDTRTQSRTRIYSTHPDAPAELVIQDNIPAYIVVDPYRWRGNYHRRDWSPSKRGFHQHHHGPGWQKHWQHHQKALNQKK